MKEVDVTLSDFLLTVQCWFFAYQLWGPLSGPRLWILAIFILIGLSALLGGIVHGYPHKISSGLITLFWQIVLLSLLLTGAVMTLWSGQILKIPLHWFALAWLVFHLIWLIRGPSFLIAVTGYLPGLLLLTMAFALQVYRGSQDAQLICVGLVLSLLAPLAQVSGIALHKYLTHNTIYHLIQFAAFFPLYLGFSKWLGGAR